ncbi:unnamed protein product [Schistosoma rodhaini]|uniref:Ephrin RBD domain-containing protein n=1 Tax=Schistosoma rodhaini TaxID=6188 RepID=A0AA85F9F5_9TREM|nr:unnamed protein product [Schistosoma rodhaini]
MQKTCLMEITVIILIKFTSAELQDHIILWDASNWRFKENQNDINATEGDNLIFICPKNRTFSQNLYWTDDPRVQLKCNKTLPLKVIKLLDCFGNKSVTEFVLKVSRFPEIASLPSFHSEIPVYFVAQSVICQQNNFRLSVKLMSDNKTDVNNQIVTTEEMQTKKHSRKLDLFSNTSISSQLKTTQIQHHLNDSSNILRNQEYNTKQRSSWIEYRLLFLPATLAFFTLIGIQIVLCGFCFSNSITQKLIKCFKKCKHKHNNLELQTNHMYKNYPIERYLNKNSSIQSTYKLTVPKYEPISNVNSCWKSKPSLSINKYDLKNTTKQQNCLNSDWLIHLNRLDNYASLYKFNDHQPKSNLFISDNPENLLSYKNSIINQNIPDTSTILCNCINQSTNMRLIQNQELLIPVSICLNKNIVED